MQRSTQVFYPLALELACVTADPVRALADEIAFAGANGSPLYLWRHTGCPGQFRTGCCRLSSYQNKSVVQRKTELVCHLKDASRIRKCAPYRIVYPIRERRRVSHELKRPHRDDTGHHDALEQVDLHFPGSRGIPRSCSAYGVHRPTQARVRAGLRRRGNDNEPSDST